MLFREHRETLEDSMKTVIEVGNLTDIAVAFFKAHPDMPTGQYVFHVAPYAYDDRIQWRTNVVTMNGDVIGFTNKPWIPKLSYKHVRSTK